MSRSKVLDISTRELALRVRRHALNMVHASNSSRIGPCLSLADVLCVVYGGFARLRPDDPEWQHRDRVVVSKGHAAAAVVTIEEHSKIAGLRDAIAPVLVERATHPRLVALGVEDGATLGVVRGQDAMRRHCGIDASSIASRVEHECANLP